MLALGLIKTHKLFRAHWALSIQRENGNMDRIYQQYAQIRPHEGFTVDEFRNMSAEVLRVTFSEQEVRGVFMAINSAPVMRQREVLPYGEFTKWSQQFLCGLM